MSTEGGHMAPVSTLAPGCDAARSSAWLHNDTVLSWLLLIILLLVWEFGVKLAGIRALILPPPSAIFQALMHGLLVPPLARESYVLHTLVTASEALLGLVIGCSAGIVVGVVVSQSKRAERLLLPYILAIQSLPKVALAPLFIIWLGYGIQSKVWIIILLTFFPLMINTIAGLRAVDPDMVDMARAAGGTRWTIFRHVLLPMALPYIFAGLDMAVVYSVVGAIVGEFVGASQGLGLLIQQMTIVMDTQGMFSVFIMLSLMGILFSAILKIVRRRVLFWAPSERSTVSL
jgi:NitT/TauT family transport system permease protein